MQSYRKLLTLLLTGCMLLCIAASSGPAFAADGAPASPAVADASQMTTVEEVVEEGMTPIGPEFLKDGVYPITVKSSSSMFRIESALLTVKDGSMTATLTMGGKSYLYVYPGSAMDAATGDAAEYIPYTLDEEDRCCFTIPVSALDAAVSCAAFSKNKELWYDRSLLFRADSLPMEAFVDGFFVTARSLKLEDGAYTVGVTLSGGSGKASVQSPARLTVKDGACEAELVWSSKNYDYMKLGEEKFLPVSTEGNATFLIPVPYFDRPVSVIADTVAMSQPHEISYTLLFDAESLEPLS